MSSPIRTCVGCRTKDEQSRLIRYVLRGIYVVPDKSRRAHGRGAWTHDDERCVRLAIHKGGFAKAFRVKVDVNEII